MGVTPDTERAQPQTLEIDLDTVNRIASEQDGRPELTNLMRGTCLYTLGRLAGLSQRKSLHLVIDFYA
jgi:hypothetical protein